MVSLKILVVFALVAVVVCEPSDRDRPKTSVKIKQKHHRRRSGTEVAIKGGPDDGFRFVFKGLQRNCKYHPGLYKDLVKLRVPGNINDVLSYILQLGVGASDAVDMWIPGLGDILSKLIGVALRAIGCILGLLGDKKFCKQKYYDTYFGTPIDDVTDINKLLERFKCGNARKQIDGLINPKSNGQGVKYFKGSEGLVGRLIYDILKIVEKLANVTVSDVTELIQKILSLILGISNAYSKNLGNDITDDIVKIINKLLVDAGLPSLSDKENDIIKCIGDANGDDDDSPWSNEPDDDDDDGNTDDKKDDGKDDDDKKNKDDDDDDDKKKKDDNDDDDDKKKKKKDDDRKKRRDKDDDEKKKKKGCDDKTKDGKSANNTLEITATAKLPITQDLAIFCAPITHLKGRVRLSSQVVNDLIGIDSISNFIDVAKFLSNLAILLASVVNSLLAGVGKVLGRIFLFIPRATLCLGNGNEINQGYCSKKFVSIYNVNGDASDLQSLRKLFKIKNAERKLMKHVRRHTKGRGIKAVVKGAQKHVLAACVRVARLCDNFDDTSYSKFYIELAKIMGIVGNSFDKNNHQLGDKITNDMSAACDKYIQQKGYDTITDNKGDIKHLAKCGANDTTFNTVITTYTHVTVTTTTEITEEEDTEYEYEYDYYYD